MTGTIGGGEWFQFKRVITAIVTICGFQDCEKACYKSRTNFTSSFLLFLALIRSDVVIKMVYYGCRDELYCIL